MGGQSTKRTWKTLTGGKTQMDRQVRQKPETPQARLKGAPHRRGLLREEAGPLGTCRKGRHFFFSLRAVGNSLKGFKRGEWHIHLSMWKWSGWWQSAERTREKDGAYFYWVSGNNVLVPMRNHATLDKEDVRCWEGWRWWCGNSIIRMGDKKRSRWIKRWSESHSVGKGGVQKQS